MKHYSINLTQNNQMVGEGYGEGNSAMEAFENGVRDGSIILPINEEVEVVAVSDSGLGIAFTVNQIS